MLEQHQSAQEFLSRFSQLADSTSEQGTLFEKLSKEWLLNAPAYRGQLDQAWLWNELNLGQDHGIDLVARTHDGDYWAIQCKFFAQDHSLDKKDIDSFFTASGKHYDSKLAGEIEFSQRVIVSTTAKWSAAAEKALENQSLPCTRVDFANELANANINWDEVFTLLTKYPHKDTTVQLKVQPDPTQTSVPDDRVSDVPEVNFTKLLRTIVPAKLQPSKQLRPHQTAALKDVVNGLKTADRGKLIMACGTGKTFTALKIAEAMVQDGGNILILVPSLALLSQTLREWSKESPRPLRNFAVCSDVKVGKDSDDTRIHDLAIPATTTGKKLAAGLTSPAASDKKNPPTNVVLATYHSIDVVKKAQELGAPEFNLIICDEAHRTTGAHEQDDTQSYFTRIHDADYIKGNKRLYMTATPRIYTESAKAKANRENIAFYSMDDAKEYGAELHRLEFSTAVRQGLLSDYKVVLIRAQGDQIANELDRFLSIKVDTGRSKGKYKVTAEDLVKIIGCWKGLAKITGGSTEFEGDPAPMQRAVIFVSSIVASKYLTALIPQVIKSYLQENPTAAHLQCETAHVDGTQNALTKNRHIEWLKADLGENQCRILSNVRCLSEGVDVPALDAAIFMHPRKSEIDIVQSVGRVMRKAEGKKYGYIILPITVPEGEDVETALDKNDSYKTVYQVLRALRAHDSRMDIDINQLDLNKKSERIIIIGGEGEGEGDDNKKDDDTDIIDREKLKQTSIEAFKNAVFATIAKKCGDRQYWDVWAKDVADIATNTTARIRKLLNENPKHQAEFEKFVNGLRKNLNPQVSEDQALEMLAQHVISRPVFEALFGNDEFVKQNPVSKTMQTMLDLLESHSLTTATRNLDAFYQSVQDSVTGIETAEGKQKVITKLYEKFFKTGFPKMAEALGIAYTPVEVVDFIIHSIDHLLKKEFGRGITAKDVHLLDPFTGTGTFIARLLQSNLIDPADLSRKYRKEIHANEIVLLAYYIAAINIEQTYQQRRASAPPVSEPYRPFDGITLTDTFQLNEMDDQIPSETFPVNSARVLRQKNAPIRVVFGNPPYSAQQKSENDDNQNMKYAKLDASIEGSYARHSTATLKRNLYDSYVRAIRWASDRIGEEGIVAYVSNGSYIDSKAADGFRKCLNDEFSSIYCFNLRGNIRKNMQNKNAGEGGNIFGQASMTGIAVLLLVKNPTASGECTIHYHDIGDNLARKQKVKIISQFASVANVPWQTVTPDEHNDWINRRDQTFASYLPIGDAVNKQKGRDRVPSIFTFYSMGVVTSRDAWVYNFSQQAVVDNVQRMIAVYNSEIDRYSQAAASGNTPKDVGAFINNNSKKISWSRALKKDLVKQKDAIFNGSNIRAVLHRPFVLQEMYFDRRMNEMVYLQPYFFPTPTTDNLAICVSGVGAGKEFSALMVNRVSDLELVSKNQCFPRYTFHKNEGADLLTDGDYQQLDNIPPATVQTFCNHYKTQHITGDNLFYYVYAVLHNPTYKQQYAADLKKTLPRIPFAPAADVFHVYAKAGKQLADLHIHYEQAEPYPMLVREDNAANRSDDYFKVVKMKYRSKADTSTIIYNNNITLENIPPEAQQYIVNGKPALGWIIDRYQIKTDKASGIINDPNALLADNPRMIIDLIAKVITVSVQTVKIINALPDLGLSARPAASKVTHH